MAQGHAKFPQGGVVPGSDPAPTRRSDRRADSLVARPPPKNAAATDVESMLLTQRCQQPPRNLTHWQWLYRKELNPMHNTLKTAAIVLALAAPASPAEELAPDALVKTISLDVIAAIRQDT